MAIIDRPRGFRPRRHLHGNVDWNHEIFATRGNNDRTIMIGDAVTLDGNGDIQKWPTAPVSAGGRPVLGVAVALYDANRRPLTHSLPSNGQLIGPGVAAHIGVVIDPDVTYTVQYDTSLGRSDLWRSVAVTAGSGVTALGQSGLEAAGASSALPSLSHPFLVVGIADELEAEDPLDGGGANQDIEVVLRRGIVLADS